jgi:membrane protein implicated in regulation of membrane protease activity
MSSPAKSRDPSHLFLMLGIFMAAFGMGWLINWRHPVVGGVLLVVGLAVTIVMRVYRNRVGRRP